MMEVIYAKKSAQKEGFLGEFHKLPPNTVLPWLDRLNPTGGWQGNNSTQKVLLQESSRAGHKVNSRQGVLIEELTQLWVNLLNSCNWGYQWTQSPNLKDQWAPWTYKGNPLASHGEDHRGFIWGQGQKPRLGVTYPSRKPGGGEERERQVVSEKTGK